MARTRNNVSKGEMFYVTCVIQSKLEKRNVYEVEIVKDYPYVFSDE